MYNVKDYGAIGNGLVDDLLAIKKTITTCVKAGGGTVYFPAGTYYISDTVIVPSKVVIKGAGVGMTVIDQKDYQGIPAFATPIPAISKLVQTSDLGKGNLSNQILNSIAKGDFITYRSRKRFTEAWDDGNAIRSYYHNGEIFKIKEASSTQVIFTEPAHLDLPVSQSVNVEAFTPNRNIGISDLTIKREIDTSSPSVSILIRYCDTAHIQRINSMHTNVAGVHVDRSMNIKVEDCEVTGGTIHLGLNYGILVSDGSKNVTVRNLTTYNCRHGFAGGGSGYAIPINCLLDGAYLMDTQHPSKDVLNHALDCHANTMNFTMTNIFTDTGLSISGVGHIVENVHAVDGNFTMYDGGIHLVFRNIHFQSCRVFYSNRALHHCKFMNVYLYMKNWTKNITKNTSTNNDFQYFTLINGDFKELPTMNNTHADNTIPSGDMRYGLLMRKGYTLTHGHIEGFPQGIYVDGGKVTIRDTLIRDCGWESRWSTAEASIVLTRNANHCLVDNVNLENIRRGLSRGSGDSKICWIRLLGTGDPPAKQIIVSHVRTTTASVWDPNQSKVGDSGFLEVLWLNCRLSNSGGGNTHEEDAKFLYCSFHSDN